jgi:hypothetical protein
MRARPLPRAAAGAAPWAPPRTWDAAVLVPSLLGLAATATRRWAAPQARWTRTLRAGAGAACLRTPAPRAIR